MNIPKMLDPLSNVEAQAIRAVASPLLQNVIDLVLLTGQRRSDVLNMKFTDIKDGYLNLTQQKTGHNISIKVTPQLQEVINRCNDGCDPCAYIIHNQRGKVRCEIVSTAFIRACKATGLYKDYKRLPSFHQVVMLAMGASNG